MTHFIPRKERSQISPADHEVIILPRPIFYRLRSFQCFSALGDKPSRLSVSDTRGKAIKRMIQIKQIKMYA